MEYLIAFILAAAGVVVNKKMTTAPRIIYLAIICIYVILVVGLRYRVGVDTISYMNSFRHIRDLNHIFDSDIFSYRYEPGYLLLNSFVKSFTKEFWVLQLIVAAVVNGCIFTFLYQNCKNVFVGVIIFLYLQWFYFNMEIMRESIAISIFLLNYRNLENNNWIRYYLFSLLCISFHYSAVVTCFFPLAKVLKPNITFVVLCMAALAVTPLFERLNEMLSVFSFGGRLDMYVSTADKLNINWKLAELMRTGAPAILTLLAYRKFKEKCRFEKMLLLQIAFCMGAFAMPIIFSRFTNYTSLFATVALANFLCMEINARKFKMCLICLIILTQGFYYYSMYPRWFPYVSIFEPRQIHEREQIWKHDFITWR